MALRVEKAFGPRMDTLLRMQTAFAGGAYMPPFGMYAIMGPRSAVSEVPVHSNPIAKRSHTSQNDVCATRDRTTPIALVSGRDAQVVVRRLILGVEAQCLSVFRDRTVHVALAENRVAEIGARPFIIGVQAHRLACCGHTSVPLLLLIQDIGQAKVNVGATVFFINLPTVIA